MKTLISILLFSATTLPLSAQNTKGGGITADMLKTIKSEAKSPSDKAIFNAISNNSIDNLARTRESQNEVDAYFSVETKKQSITNQKSSGRCWMFSGLNVLRGNLTKRTDSLSCVFSHDYLFFWDQLEKANLCLQGMIDTAKKPMDDDDVRFFFRSPLGDGGTFCGVADLADKYGLVPKSVVPETFASESTSRMSSLIKSKLREYGLQLRRMVAQGKKPADIKAAKTKMLATVYHMLSLTLGEPPTEFTYAFRDASGKAITPAKNYTPMSFYEEVMGGKKLTGSFVMLMNDPRRPYHKTYQVQWDRHTYDGQDWCYLNLPIEEIEEIAIKVLKDGTKMYSSYDAGKFLDRKRGVADLNNFDYGSLFSTTFPMTKAERIETFDSGSTHAMTLTAVDLDANGKPLKWAVENSWGADSGYKGYVIMTDEWFREYMFRLVVDKQYLSEDIIKEAAQKPLIVSPEDPLFAEDE